MAKFLPQPGTLFRAVVGPPRIWRLGGITLVQPPAEDLYSRALLECVVAEPELVTARLVHSARITDVMSSPQHLHLLPCDMYVFKPVSPTTLAAFKNVQALTPDAAGRAAARAGAGGDDAVSEEVLAQVHAAISRARVRSA